ncbi:MAG: hypothetical protein EU532_15005 [Promethearchaeota archaeon]|nr:MAG: hypothetical protein EU532_15005 [Candidatus Lokiarchaeota archaeon]
MLYKKQISVILTSFIILIMIFSTVGFLRVPNKIAQNDQIDVKSSTSIEGFENIKATEIIRNINISTYGLVNIDDKITILNQNSNPINSIFIGIPLDHSDDLIYIRSYGLGKNEFVIERTYLNLDDYEVISIYLDTPLLPQKSITFRVIKTYKNLLEYSQQNLEQKINFTGLLFPILPYKAEGNIKSTFRLPSGATALSYDQPFGMGNPLTSEILLYDLGATIELNHLDPFLENRGDEKIVSVIIGDNTRTNMQLENVKREIDVSPWGIIRVREDYIVQNIGEIEIYTFSFKIPQDGINLIIFDDLGELLGTTIDEASENYKEVSINLLNNRAAIKPDSKLTYSIQYNIPFDDHFSINWFDESIKIDLISTKFEFLAIEQEIRVNIEGCGNINYVSMPPDAIKHSSGSKVLIYQSEQVSPLEKKEALVTFTINLFDLMIRPLIIILLLVFILTSFVLLIKTRKKEEKMIALKTEIIPVNEIREFCSLYEEKNALMLEIRNAEEEAKRKKMAKKSYKNIVSKNTIKIEQIKNEIQPFKKILIESGENFENVVKKLDVLDAERLTVDDSINLLENRYKRGKLPSRQAYQKLSDDFFKRRKKIDRTIDKYIQQLRSYLL